jgi:hypothetical protein
MGEAKMPLAWAWIALAAIVTWAFADGGKTSVENDGNVARRSRSSDRGKPRSGNREHDGARKRVKRKSTRKKGKSDELAPERKNDGGDVPGGSGNDLRGERDGSAPENPGVNPDQHKEGESK